MRGRRLSALVGASVVPWIATGPQLLAPPPLARPCQAGALRISQPGAGHGILQGATGSLLGFVAFQNTGPTCSLLGRPRVRLVGNGAARVVQRDVPVRSGRPTPGELPATVSVRALPHGAVARALVQWFNWCSPGATRTRGNVAPQTIVFTLPRGGSLAVAADGAARCDRPGKPSDIDVGPFVADQPAPTRPRLPFRVRLGATSYTARAGATLDYRVELTSTGRGPFRFGRCPAYSEVLGSSHGEVHYLNCRAVGTVGPGATVVFDIHLHVPATMPAGRTGLFFDLGIDTARPLDDDGAYVVITR